MKFRKKQKYTNYQNYFYVYLDYKKNRYKSNTNQKIIRVIPPVLEDFFWKIANRFRNKKIWKRDSKKQWYIQNWIGGDKKPDKFPHTKLSNKEKINLTD